MLELSGWVSVGSFVSRSQPGAFLFVSSVFRRMGVAQKRFLVFVTRSGGFPTSSFVKGSCRRWSMALRAVLLAHSSLNAFCSEIHFGLPKEEKQVERVQRSNFEGSDLDCSQKKEVLSSILYHLQVDEICLFVYSKRWNSLRSRYRKN